MNSLIIQSFLVLNPMVKDVLNEREFELINILGQGLGANQRDLSQQMQLSLGMVNLIIRRLIAKGYIRIEQLNKRKVQYLLTPKGFAEKMQKSIKYTLKTINSIAFIREHIKNMVLNLKQTGYKDFIILGDSDLSVLLEMALREHFSPAVHLRRVKELPPEGFNGMLLICKEGYENGKCPRTNTVNVLEEIARSGMFSLKGVLDGS
ncbi:MAG: winged helix-turn-helix transcriptional regulator [Candidatus Omnitrophica bacterium]|nr:winged helix-turn-helix transcriptional regulator [Candidatus Omnitrophota bacterium]